MKLKPSLNTNLRKSSQILKLDMKEDPDLLKWLETGRVNKPLKPSTYESHINKFWKYVESTGKLPSELLLDAEEQQEKYSKLARRDITTHFAKLRQELEKEGKSQRYIKAIFISVKAFYNYYEIITPKMEFITNDNDDTTESLPSKNDIRKAMSLANPEYQAIILLISSSGLAGGDVRNLSIGDYLRSLDIQLKEPLDNKEILEKLKEKENKETIPLWQINRIKNDKKCTTFSSPESVKAINTYIQQRIDNNDLYLELEDKLFETVIYTNGERKTIEIRDRTLSIYFRRLTKRCKFDKKIGENKNIGIFSSHNLRRWFRSTIYNKGEVDSDTAELLMGHKLDKVRAAYAKTDPKHLKKQYLKALPFLTINEPVEINQNQDEITRLNAELENTNQQLAMIKNEKDEKIDKLEKKQEVLERIVEELMENQLNKN